MAKNFQVLGEFLQKEFPDQWSSIKGENYPAPEWAAYAQQVVSAVQMFVMALALMGDGIWEYVPGFKGREPPQIYLAAKENPVLALMGIFIFLPTFVQSFVTSGAFEVYLDGSLVFSKIEQGRMPNLDEIRRIMEAAGLQHGM